MNTTAGVTEWRVHIGAHKTGTTHLQTRLADAADHLEQHGVTYIPLPDIRQRLRPWVNRAPYNRWAHQAARASRHARKLVLRRKAADLAAALQAGKRVPGPLIVSEENILRHAWRWDGPSRIYPSVHMLHYLDGLSDLAPLRIFLAIRSMDEFVVSYYAERLKFDRLRRDDLDRKIDEILEAGPVWVDLIARLRKAMPRARLEVWNYDDYSTQSHKFAESLCGVALPSGKDAEWPKSKRKPQRRPTASAIAAAEALDLPSGPERERLVTALFANTSVDTRDDRFDPISPENRRTLRDAFRQDLREIETRFPSVLKTF